MIADFGARCRGAAQAAASAANLEGIELAGGGGLQHVAIRYAAAHGLLDGLEKSPYRDNTIVVLWSDHGWSLGEKSHWRKFALWEEPTRTVFVWRVPGLTKAGGVCGRTVDFSCI